MKRSVLTILVVALYFLHQDYWFWFSAEPLVFGIFPIGLFTTLCIPLLLQF